MTGSSQAPKHPGKHETHPPRVKKKKEFRLDSNDCGFICAGVNFVAELFVINQLQFEHQ